MALTTEQLLLLNNLMYMSSGKDSPLISVDSSTGLSVGDWLNQIDVNQLTDNRDYGSLMTGSDWKNIIRAAQSDETLMNMTIATTHTDSAGGGGQSAVFINSSTGDAVVAFKGTASQEWGDNFTGGNVTDTPYQQNALAWYQSTYKEYGLDGYDVTITGHSKGGNKAKYITLLDDSVDHCVSFDGQGFSDEFMEKYAAQISERQSLIENHNVDYDFVNLLLNDVGERTYYQGFDYGDGGFVENHCTNTFMNFDENGNFTMVVNPNGQAPEMKALDEFLNNLIRSMPENQQTETLKCINVIIDNIFSLGDRTAEENLNLFIDLLSDSEYSDELAYVLAYTIEYEQAHPEFADHINSVLSKFGMDDFTQYVDMVDGILNFEADYFLIGHVDFDRLYSLITGAAGILPDGVLQWILDWVEKEYGVKLTVQQLRNLLTFAGMVYDDMQNIKIQDNGSDIQIPSAGVDNSNVSPHGRIVVDLKRMHSLEVDFLNVAGLLERASLEVENVASELRIAQQYMGATTIRSKLLTEKKDITKLAERIRQLENAITVIAGKYEGTESLIVTFL